jgi:hypothetical protein
VRRRQPEHRVAAMAAGDRLVVAAAQAGTASARSGGQSGSASRPGNSNSRA